MYEALTVEYSWLSYSNEGEQGHAYVIVEN